VVWFRRGASLSEPWLHLVLFQPEIPPNTGNCGRLAVGLGLRLHVVHPIPFRMDEKAVRRAGLDYWRHVDLQEHATPEAFWAWAEGRRLHGYTTRATRPFTAASHAAGDVLIFGCETRGLPAHEVARLEEHHATWRIPMTGPIRSLNLANAVSVVTYGAMQQVRPEIFVDGPEAP
jgi:tRNA (cytidine/uridine-2'-O-)-methyltransferase